MEDVNFEAPFDMELVSPYDPTYPVRLLSQGLRIQLDHAKKASESIYKAVVKAAPAAAQLWEATKKGFRLVVDAEEETLKAIESGKIKLTMEKGGKTYAQIREASGHYGKKLPIKKEIFAKGVDPVQAANALQMQALQRQVQQISDQIIEIDQSVREVLQGQQNDRIGIYYSGVALYLEARNVSDPELRRALLAQSMKALTDASFQLLLTMQSDIRYLADGEYNHAKGKKVDLIDERMRRISNAFAIIHQAALLRAGIYANEGELSAMAAVLSEYSRFIDETVAKNADILAQCDVTDNGLETGVWKSRKHLKLDVSQLVQKLNHDEKTIYLTVPEEEAQ